GDFVTMFWAVPPTFWAPSWVPFHDASLNDLSLRPPTSVTRPIFRALPAGLLTAVWLPAGVATVPVLGDAELPLPHAPTTSDMVASSESPIERLRMCPP